MAAITITIVGSDDRIFTIQVEDNTEVSTIKAILEVESGVPAGQQVLVLNNAPLANDSATAAAAGITDGSMLMLLPAQAAARPAGQAAPQRQVAPGRDPMLALSPEDGTAVNPAAFIQAVRADPATMAALTQTNPGLAAAIRSEDIERLQEELRHAARSTLAARKREQELERLYQLADMDPFNTEVQAKILELINEKNIHDNFEAALENNPEAFASVHMLYVNMKVNGVPVKAFVDSGAQMTIMTQDFAEKCHLGRLVDKRFQGMAVGVGSSKIIGKVHAANVMVGDKVAISSITVLEQKSGPQFIYGLDNLKRHACVLDLAKGELRFGSVEVTLPFLPEHEIPKTQEDFNDAIEATSEAQAEKNIASSTGQSTGTAGPSTSQPAAGAAPSTAPSAPAPSQPPPNPTFAASNDMDGKVQQLVALGFTPEMARQALEAANGNVEVAASMMFA